MPKTPEPTPETLAETENYLVWKAEESDGETVFFMQINNISVSFYKEEWEEFLATLTELDEFKPEEDGIYELEVPGAVIFFDEEEWTEFKKLISELE
jgi:hypothetical protein